MDRLDPDSLDCDNVREAATVLLAELQFLCFLIIASETGYPTGLAI